MQVKSSRSPHQYKRRILLATVGLVPQVITETLYHLCVRQNPPFIPTEIHVVTTGYGRRQTQMALLDPSRAQLAKFAAEFDLPNLPSALIPDRIHVVADSEGKLLDDITDHEGNEKVADLVIRVIRELAGDEEAALHVSIAGGRKTMGFLAGYALSLFGRQQDRLSHVLVQPRSLETHPQFFFPPKRPVVLYDKQEPNKAVSTADARIVLAEIPFVRLRDGLPTRLLDGGWTYSETVRNAQASLSARQLVIDVERQLVSCQGIVFRLTAKPFAFYALLARKRLADPDGDGLLHWTSIGGDEYVSEYWGLPEAKPDEVGALRSSFRNIGKDGQDDPRKLLFEQAKTRLHQQLGRHLGPYAKPYEVVTRKQPDGKNLWGLDLPIEAITFGRIEVETEDQD